RVRARPAPLYAVEVWKDGVRQTVVPITKPEITIGRGSQAIAADLPIKGDPEVSRVHAVLMRDNGGRFWLTAKGRNPTIIAGREAPRDERVALTPDDKIEICSFTLRVQPK
nr:FHA domain-containing protein [Pyrinomonadaceae bacterium]